MVMKCFLCGGKGVIKQQKGRDLCARCFSNIIEKRIRKHVRMNKLFKKNDRILVLGGVNKFLVESILKKLPVKLFFRKREDKEFVKKNNINKIVVEWTLDDEVNEFMKAVLEGKKVKEKGKKYVKLLKVVTDKELLFFAKFNKIKFKPKKKDEIVQIFLDEVEDEHPNIKYNLLNNISMLNRLTGIGVK